MTRLVLIETSGNQEFVFSTNKLRQNIGASELIHRIGTCFALSAVARFVPAYAELATLLEQAIADGDKPGTPVATKDYVEKLQAASTAGPVAAGCPAEVLIATSGKAVLLVQSEAVGREIIRTVTLRALREAPGAVVRGVIDDVEIDLGIDTKTQAHLRMKEVHHALDRLRLTLPPPEARFPVLPITALCSTSGLPAEHLDNDELLSEPALRKRRAATAGWRRIKASLGTNGAKLARNVAELDDLALSWFGVVHADGNGFGKVFLDLACHMPPDAGMTARAYFDFYRNLSISLDLAGVTALHEALEHLRGDKLNRLPLVPLVFGGDDLTVVCDGAQAIQFTINYLGAFERATSAEKLYGIPSVIPSLIDPLTKTPKTGFGGGGGIAIVKPHHPFHRAYDLAEELTKSAKTTKSILKPDNPKGTSFDAISAFDFQVVYDDAAADLAKLRQAWSIGDCRLHNRPYVTSDRPRIDVNDPRGWIAHHRVDKLTLAVEALTAGADDDADRPRLPRSQQHVLRGSLFAGKEAADARLALIQHRYGEQTTTKLAWHAFGDEPGRSLFYEQETTETGPDKNVRFRTRLIDALELIDLGENFTAPVKTEPASAAPVEETAT